MKARIITAVLLLPLIIFLLWYGRLPLIIVLCGVTIIGLYEFFAAVKLEDRLLRGMAFLLVIITYSFFWTGDYTYMNLSVLMFIALSLGIYVFKYPKISLDQLGFLTFGMVYILYLLLHIALVRETTPEGIWSVWLIFIIAFGSDSAAYFVGVNFGKNKLVPKLSPKKTIEGALGGVLGAGILCTIFGILMLQYGLVDTWVTLPMFFVIGIFGSVVSQIGDLVGSAMKRQTQIKDFGKIIPGHGGILDRLDSILLTAPYVYIIVTMLY
ncbi:phosphatidate cytidylyltransferase [Petrocella sp. FN5]|uniref:phosphatidate cytidylyltransferase n=1 Tax=Petrocella sp. FN5 TaxID=3032002 RepID=UPI0023DC6E56|nr:phosphatidate cytidylyltransferase [Petrocella sp. FN5]MDF1616790.1 phosphatidate cytidylyltransferase [Petrocella sp. FN5]